MVKLMLGAVISMDNVEVETMEPAISPYYSVPNSLALILILILRLNKLIVVLIILHSLMTLAGFSNVEKIKTASSESEISRMKMLLYMLIKYLIK